MQSRSLDIFFCMLFYFDIGMQSRSLGQAHRQRERLGTPVGNPADLAEFLGAMGLGKYAHALTDNEIDLEAVQLMADSDFQDIGGCFGGVCLFLVLFVFVGSWPTRSSKTLVGILEAFFCGVIL